MCVCALPVSGVLVLSGYRKINLFCERGMSCSDLLTGADELMGH